MSSSVNVETRYGFQFGHLNVSRCWSHKGRVCVRILNIESGAYVDVQTSPKGHKQYVSVGSMTKDAAKEYVK